MRSERWRQVDAIFKSALELPCDDRAAFLDHACEGDQDLREEVESLIAHDRAESFMKTPADGDAFRLLAKDRSELLIGQSLGPYKIVEKLVSGGRVIGGVSRTDWKP
jgi:hypothetical protein